MLNIYARIDLYTLSSKYDLECLHFMIAMLNWVPPRDADAEWFPCDIIVAVNDVAE